MLCLRVAEPARLPRQARQGCGHSIYSRSTARRSTRASLWPLVPSVDRRVPIRPETWLVDKPLISQGDPASRSLRMIGKLDLRRRLARLCASSRSGYSCAPRPRPTSREGVRCWPSGEGAGQARGAATLPAGDRGGRPGVRARRAGMLPPNVLQDEADENVYYFYEVYASQAALEAHRATPHYARRRAAADTLDGPTEAIRCRPASRRPVGTEGGCRSGRRLQGASDHQPCRPSRPSSSAPGLQDHARAIRWRSASAGRRPSPGRRDLDVQGRGTGVQQVGPRGEPREPGREDERAVGTDPRRSEYPLFALAPIRQDLRRHQPHEVDHLAA